jgi:RNA polymerase sigma-70 factor, ECF subfamily
MVAGEVAYYMPPQGKTREAGRSCAACGAALWQDGRMVGLLAAFLRSWRGPPSALPRDLEEQLAAVCEAARAPWPKVTLEAAGFVGYLAAHTDPSDDPGQALATLRVADLYLACACAEGQPAAIEELERICLAASEVFLRQFRQPPAFADEVRQIVLSRALVGDGEEPPRITQYAGRGTLASWVGITAQRTALSLLRGDVVRGRATHEAMAQALPLGGDPELDYLKARYRREFRDAFMEAIAALPAHERVLLRLHLVEGLSHERIGAMYQVNQSTITRRVARARDTILRETQQALRRRLHVETAEFESLAALVGSELDLSLSRLLGEGAGGDSPA